VDDRHLEGFRGLHRRDDVLEQEVAIHRLHPGVDGTAPENRVAMTAELLIALFVGLSVPVIGAGVALDQGASAPNTVLGFAILVGLGVAGAGWGLLARRPKSSPQAA
jgi:hypothetical protein